MDFETSSGVLDANSLTKLARGDTALIWHSGFYSMEACQAVLPRIVQACKYSNYTLTDDLQSFGTSIGEASESATGAQRYIETAADTTRLIRDQIFGNIISPVDRIRLTVDEWWPAGAVVAKSEGRQMLPTIIRRWPAGGHAKPHIDQRHVPLLENYKLSRRIGVNVYLEVPEEGLGGELEFWGRIENEADYVAKRRGDYGLDREELGEPMHSFLPAQGDLVMFDTARVHGVREVKRGARVTVACFLGIRAEEDPIVVFA